MRGGVRRLRQALAAGLGLTIIASVALLPRGLVGVPDQCASGCSAIGATATRTTERSDERT